MNRKGQIFSIDFIIAMSIVIIFFGIILSMSEMKTYENNAFFGQESLMEKAEAGSIALTNSQYSCSVNNDFNLAYSIDKTKISGVEKEKLKEFLGLEGINAQLKINGNIFVLDDELNGTNTYSVEIDLMVCNTDIAFSNLEECMNGPCGIQKETVSLAVSK